MFYRLALISSFVLVNYYCLTTSALAEVTFKNVLPGTLEPTGTEMKVLQSLTPVTLIVNVPENRNAQITILPPTSASSPSEDPNGTTRVGFLKFGSTNLRSDNSDNTKNIANLPTGNTVLEVGMRVQRPVAFSPGTYNYSLNLSVTITPP
ncbi:hypothetical protein LC608_14230 [Nostoc sp. XA010]|uniref:hypothetical protein n=1 Tax=Nostoc sp. XA010 TaxID=2780407 RepID=UPI001E2C133C|nr:hypothetical protein [Nostoc sp. XA010]MCC5658126.1 hypothetical protein [Nostoc sp. XA010]